MSNKELRRIVAVLAAILTISIITSCNAIKGYANYKRACNAVDNYIEKTADTGEMDEFLESPEGQAYVKYSKLNLKPYGVLVNHILFMTGIRKADTLEELSIDYFNQHYILEGKQRKLLFLLKDAKVSPDSHITWNTKEVYHVDTLLRNDKWRVQLRVKYNLDFSSVIPQELIADLLHTLDVANDISFIGYYTIGYPHEEVMITLTLAIPFK